MQDQKNTEAFMQLSGACDALSNTKLILSAPKIAGILAVIASNEVLKELVSECMKGFEYPRDLENSFYRFGAKVRFKLPQNPQKIVALIVNLFFDFDDGKISFVEFITASFPEYRADDNYKLFCKDVVAPFLEAVKSLLFKESAPAVGVGGAELLDERAHAVDGAIKQNAERLFKELRELIRQHAVGDIDASFFVIDGLGYAVETGDFRLMRISAIAIKALLRDYRVFAPALAEIEDLIKRYSIA
ncbi:MAG: hypothetical protein LBQ40_01710 [Clostridiales bacterium]|jgi:hypothetical protein|nr:hypothetical protein [Clostridiales bacterium]